MKSAYLRARFLSSSCRHVSGSQRLSLLPSSSGPPTTRLPRTGESISKKFNNPADKEDFIDDNGHHHLANYDREGRAYYADRPATPTRLKPAPASLKKKDDASTAGALIEPFGYKALKSGTSKQRAWAEKIRSVIIRHISEEIRGAFTDAPFHTAKFWIDNREKTSAKFEAFARRDIELANSLWCAHDSGNFTTSRRLREEPDALQSWFEI